MPTTTYKGLSIRTPDPSGAGGLLINDNFAEIADRVPPGNYTTTNPTVDDDTGDNYEIGSRWINTSSGEVWICLDNSSGAAVWQLVGFVQNDSKYSTVSDRGWFGAYNGRNNSQQYRIGLAYSLDGENWYRDGRNPIIEPTGSGWENNIVKDPRLIKVNGVIYLYYSGRNTPSNNWEVGLARSFNAGRSFERYSGNPVITKGSSMEWNENGNRFFTVLYDEDESDPTRRWKGWFGGETSGTDAEIGYAYSADGLTWTQYASNPVMTLGTGGAWDDKSMHPTAILKREGTYYLFYVGLNDSSSKWQTGLATFTDPEGTYTKDASNPILARQSDAQEALTADLSTSGTTVTVADTSVFNVNEWVQIDDDDSDIFLTRIESIDSGTTLTVADSSPDNYTTAQNAEIRSIYSGSIQINDVWREGENWRGILTCFQVWPTLLELAGFATAPALDGPWTIDYDPGVAILPDAAKSEWDVTSIENFSLIPSAGNSALLTGEVLAVEAASGTSQITPLGYFTELAVGGSPASDGEGALWIENTSSAPSADVDGVSVYAQDFGAGDSRLVIQAESGNVISFGDGTIQCDTLNVLGDDDDVPTIRVGQNTSNIARIDLNADNGGIYGWLDAGTERVLMSCNSSYDWRLYYREGGTTLDVGLFMEQSTGNFGFWTTSFGSSADKVMSMGLTDAAPTTSPADVFQLYADDIEAGHCAPHFLTENGDTVRLFRSETITAPDDTLAGTADADVIENLKTRVEELEVVLMNSGLLEAQSPRTKVPDTQASDSSYGTSNWSTMDNIEEDDGTAALSSVNNESSEYLKATGCGFKIPKTATIVGIEVVVQGNKSSSSGTVSDDRIRLVRAGTVESAEDKNNGTEWLTSEQEFTYGGAADLWSAAWTPDDINDSGFGVAIAVKNTEAVGVSARIDYVTITVYYTV